VRSFGPAEATLDGSDHQVAHHFARDARVGHGRPGDDLTVTGVNDEQHAHHLAIAGVEFEMVRAPTQVRGKHDDLAVVGSRRRQAGVALQGQCMAPHDAEHALGVDSRLTGLAQLAVDQGCHAPVAVGQPLIDDSSDQRQERSVLGLAVGAASRRPMLEPVDQVGS